MPVNVCNISWKSTHPWHKKECVQGLLEVNQIAFFLFIAFYMRMGEMIPLLFSNKLADAKSNVILPPGSRSALLIFKYWVEEERVGQSLMFTLAGKHGQQADRLHSAAAWCVSGRSSVQVHSCQKMWQASSVLNHPTMKQNVFGSKSQESLKILQSSPVSDLSRNS